MYQEIKPIHSGQKADCVKRTTDGACIPFDLANTDYQEFLRWKEEGNEPLPSDE